jgi:hypothetical protein
MNLFACQETRRDFLFAWFAESYNNVVEKLLSKDHLTYHEAKEGILKLPSNHCSPLEAASKNSKPQHGAMAISLSNAKKDEKQNKRYSSSSNSGAKECKWCPKHPPGTASRNILT